MKLQTACAAISSQCDGACKQDGVGFSKPDAYVGNLIAQVPAAEWTPETCAMVADMLSKYSIQLAGLGIDSLPELPQVVEFDRTRTYQNLQTQVDEIQSNLRREKVRLGMATREEIKAIAQQDYVGIIEGDWFQIFSPRNQNLINDIKLIQPWQVRKWNRDLFCWEVAYTQLTGSARNMLLDIINSYGFVVPDKDMDILEQPTEFEQMQVKITHVQVENDLIIFKVPFDRNAIADIKELTGRKWDGDSKIWTAPATPANMQETIRLAAFYDWNLSKDFKSEAKETIKDAEENIEASQAVEAELEIPGLNPAYDLYPFQKAGVRYALKAKRVLIGDEMGLGKTLQGSATVVAAGAFPCLVICPKAVKNQWVHEINKFFPEQTAAAFNNGKTNWDVNFLVINYDVLSRNLESLKAVFWKAVIIDESHYIKNSRTKRSQAVMELVEDVEYRIALTGTPVLNKPIELAPQLSFLNRMDEIFGGFWPFAIKHCDAHKTEYGWNMNGAAHLDELARDLRSYCFVRREKKEVFKELPALQRTNIPCSISVRAAAAFQREVKKTAKKLKKLKEQSPNAAKAEAIVEMMRLKREAAQYKYDTALEWLKNFLDSGEKLVLFAHHKDLQDKLFRDLSDFNPASITGGDSSEKREQNVNKFWNDDSCKVIVCSIKAANVGVNLQKASNVAFFEFAWHSGDMDQAEARVHRIGSEASSINSYWLIGENTFDAALVAIIEAKRQIADAVNQGIEPNKELIKLAKLDALSFFQKFASL